MPLPIGGQYVIICCLLFALNSCAKEPLAKNTEIPNRQASFPNVLDLQIVPDSADDRSGSTFMDQGAWFGFSLPEPSGLGGFAGPFLMTQDNGVWLSKTLGQLQLTDTRTASAIDLNDLQAHELNFYPGRLHQTIETRSPHLQIELELIFLSKWVAFTQLRIQNNELETIPLRVEWQGDLLMDDASFLQSAEGVQVQFEGNDNIGMIISAGAAVNVPASGRTYRLVSGEYELKPAAQWSTELAQIFCFNEEQLNTALDSWEAASQNPETVFTANQKRWNNWLNSVLAPMANPLQEQAYQEVAVKCLETLVHNWRGAAGFLLHDGLFPSYHYEWFHGFWSWDSWKHAVALASFEPELAKNQIRAMYDFQDEWGMIADCVYRDTVIEVHNWRDTKPPLSAWAIWNVFEQSADTAFLAEMYPKAEQYHRWWYTYRDHDQNGLCEYGSTDGSLIAAKWESGMDNAVRFDDVQLVQSTDNAWSMNRESVDLNAYLFAEKSYLSKIAGVLGREAEQISYEKAASSLRERIQKEFYSEKTAWFHDIELESKEHFATYGAEGWIPLWAGIATEEQAARIRETMLDASKFGTYIPFPTLAADHPRFDPDGSYWRGPVWLDQAYFAIAGLRQYGFTEDADQLSHHLLERLEGLMGETAPIRENYHPHTGAGLESWHFSWSAAHLLLLMHEMGE